MTGDEQIQMETDSGEYTFTATIKPQSGRWIMSPVPDHVDPGATVGRPVRITSETLNGWFIWMSGAETVMLYEDPEWQQQSADTTPGGKA